VNYPGNPSLAAPVKERVLSTFRQTLDLYKQGRKDEVAAGCGLILQMDPTFDPAKKLLEKSRNPALPIDVDALLPGPPSDTRPLLDQAREAMAARDFQRVIHLTSEILRDDLMNDDARILGDEAREKLEAAPFIEQFVRKSEQNINAGNYAAAKADLEKARALDAAHPAVVKLAQVIAARQSGPRPAPPPAAPSFVVDDNAPATGRAASQASDFGFTFEEDKPQEASFANFSFDSPSDSPFAFGGAPKAPAAGEFDFSTASITTTPDDQKKIEQYLADGDRAFDAGDHQQAIDLWSRIFLIDVTNEQASERIERAKAKRRDVEQKVDALIASGLGALDRKDAARARADFGEALRLDPNNAAARDHLDELNRPAEAAETAAASPYGADDQKIDLDFFEDELPAGIEPPLIPPPPGAAPPASEAEAEAKAEPKAKAKAKKAKAPSAPRKLPLGALLGVLAVVVLVAGGWFLWQRLGNKPEQETAAASDAVVARAKMLAGRGKYDEAIALLQDIKANDPQHDAALVMIADLQQKKAGSAAMIDGKPAAQYYDEKVAAARAAFDAHDYAAAKQAFEEAQRVKPLAPDAKGQYDTAANQVAQLDAAKKLFTEQRYTEAIANLQPILDQDPQNANVQKMILDAHFNLGAQALQEERTADAITEFSQVLEKNPNDDLAKRSRELALRYDKQTKDLLYRIYVKYLPLRQAA
jgi:tetratricopeptide (TPR) repeat protein